MIRSIFEEILSDTETKDRFSLWKKFLNKTNPSSILEIGVWEGEYSEGILRDVPSINRYYMLDPWRNLEDWNRPFNVEKRRFDNIYARAMKRTDFAAGKRVVLRGKTTEVIDQIPDESLDFVYIDGDHTLKGITIDLTRVYPKVKVGGIIGGDDLNSTVWRQVQGFEPTFIFPYATYFAEAFDHEFIAMPFSQFAIPKVATGFTMSDLAGVYGDRTILQQLRARPRKGWLRRKLGRIF